MQHESPSRNQTRSKRRQKKVQRGVGSIGPTRSVFIGDKSCPSPEEELPFGEVEGNVAEEGVEADDEDDALATGVTVEDEQPSISGTAISGQGPRKYIV